MATSGVKGRRRSPPRHSGATAAASRRKAPPGDRLPRLRSKEFREGLTALLSDEIRSLARMRFKDVVDARAVRKRIAEQGPRLVSEQAFGDLTIHVQQTIIDGLRKRNQSLLGLLGDDMAASVDTVLDEDPVTSARMKDFIANLMRQEFVRALFTDIVYTSIVSFNERVNPLFGRFAVGMLEEQIRGFIRLFMPMILQEATAFATNRRNQAILFEFTRAIVRRLLAEPLPSFFGMLSRSQKKTMERIVRQSLTDAGIATLTRELSIASWEALYARIKNERIGTLLHLEPQADSLAEQAAGVLLPLLSRPAVLAFIGAQARGESR